MPPDSFRVWDMAGNTRLFYAEADNASCSVSIRKKLAEKYPEFEDIFRRMEDARSRRHARWNFMKYILNIRLDGSKYTADSFRDFLDRQVWPPKKNLSFYVYTCPVKLHVRDNDGDYLRAIKLKPIRYLVVINTELNVLNFCVVGQLFSYYDINIPVSLSFTKGIRPDDAADLEFTCHDIGDVGAGREGLSRATPRDLLFLGREPRALVYRGYKNAIYT